MADQVPGLLTSTIAATVRPRSTSSETRRAGLDGERDPVTGSEPTSLRYSREAQPRAMLLAGEIEDRRPELFAVDRLAQVALEARRAYGGILQAPRDKRDGRYPTALPDVHVPQALEELAVGVLGRGEVADDDIGDEGHPDGVGGVGRRDDGAPQLEHGPEVVTGVQVVVDDQHVNTLELCETDVTHDSNRVAKAPAAFRGRGRQLSGRARQGHDRRAARPTRSGKPVGTDRTIAGKPSGRHSDPRNRAGTPPPTPRAGRRAGGTVPARDGAPRAQRRTSSALPGADAGECGR